MFFIQCYLYMWYKGCEIIYTLCFKELTLKPLKKKSVLWDWSTFWYIKFCPWLIRAEISVSNLTALPGKTVSLDSCCKLASKCYPLKTSAETRSSLLHSKSVSFCWYFSLFAPLCLLWLNWQQMMYK